MVQGIEVDLFRPDDELKSSRKLAVELDVVGRVARHVDEALAAVAARRADEWSPRGRPRRTRGSTSPPATASTATTRSGSTTPRSRSGSSATTSRSCRRARTSTGRRRAIAAERDRITGEYRALLPDDETRAAFDEKLGLSRLVFPYVENHNFYIEHWALSVFWRKIRELGQVLADAGLLAGRRRHLLPAPRRGPAGASSTTATAGRSAPSAIGPDYWPAEIERRTGHHRRAREQAAAAGAEPAAGGHHRAVHDHALRHHDRARGRSGSSGRRTPTS